MIPLHGPTPNCHGYVVGHDHQHPPICHGYPAGTHLPLAGCHAHPARYHAQPYGCNGHPCAPVIPAPANCQKPSSQGFPSSNHVGVYLVLLVDVVSAAALILSLYARRYHFTSSSIITGSIIHFDIGLMSIDVSGNYKGIISALQPASVTNFLTQLANDINGRTLAEFEAYACFADSLLFSFIPTGCNTMMTLRVASLIFITCFVIAAILLVAGAILLLLIHCGTVSNDFLIVRVAFFFHLIPGILAFLACFIYLLLGGIDLQFTPNIPLLMYDVSYIDLGSGFFIAVGTSTLALLVPVLLYFVIYAQSSSHPDRLDHAEDIQETQLLIDELRAARNAAGQYPN